MVENGDPLRFKLTAGLRPFGAEAHVYWHNGRSWRSMGTREIWGAGSSCGRSGTDFAASGKDIPLLQVAQLNTE